MLVSGQVRGYVVEPSRYGAVAPEIAYAFSGSQKGVLGYLFGILMVAEKTVCAVVYFFPMRLNQFAEGAVVAVL